MLLFHGLISISLPLCVKEPVREYRVDRPRLFILVVAIIAVRDVTQRRHAVTRNFPVIGHFRYFFEEMGQPLRQYFFAGDLEERPFNRVVTTQNQWLQSSLDPADKGVRVRNYALALE